MTRKKIISNIKKLPTDELRTYLSAYITGQIYRFALDAAITELKRRYLARRKSKR